MSIQSQEWVEDDLVAAGVRLNNIGPEELIIDENCEIWIFVENSALSRHGRITKEDFAELTNQQYFEPKLLHFYMENGKVVKILEQFVP